MNMSGPSSSPPFFEIGEEDQNQMMKQQYSSTTPTSSSAPAPAPASSLTPQKKKRNQPGTPYPDSEVIALSPKTLMATNRFICEVCNKGFQREQNLQLHRRGHNLPWKLKQKNTNQVVKRKVYLCPEPTCVHHDSSRALGDLTGIKKHYSRKHGEKKWKCDKCSKRYAVQSDWKAHSKTCGTREYRCDCGTLFSRRDSFITHRAFCDALAQESARHPPGLSAIGSHLYASSNMGLGLSQVGPHHHQLSSSIKDLSSQSNNNDILRLGGGGSRSSPFDHLLPPPIGSSPSSSLSFRPPQTLTSSSTPFFMQDQSNQQNYHEYHHQYNNLFNLSNSNGNANNNTSNILMMSAGHHHFNSIDQNGTTTNTTTGPGGGVVEGSNHLLFSNNFIGDDHQISSGVPSLFSTVQNESNMVVPHMSATVLLQKAAQMGSTSSNNNNNNTASLLRSFGSSSSSGGSKPDNNNNNNNNNFGGGGIFGTAAGPAASENDTNNLHDLMNNNPFAAAANSSIFGTGSSEHHPFAGYKNANRTTTNDEASKFQQNMNASMGGSDGMTRDFLGVGQIVRNMSGGFSQREKHQQLQQQQKYGGIDGGSLDSADRNITAPASQSFGGDGGSFK